MTISELTRQISRTGDLTIPAEIISEMGLYAGDCVRIAYISSDGRSNDFREFLLSAAGIGNTDADEQTIQIPSQLLKQANIPVDSDLQIICFDGIIVISRSSSLELAELSEVLERMKKAREYADYYSFDNNLSHIRFELADVIQYLQEGGESSAE